MKATIHRIDLKSAVMTAKEAVAKRSPLPILSHMLLYAANGVLRVSATDLEIAIMREVPATVHIDGGCTVPAKLLIDIVSQLQDDDVTLELDGPRIIIKTRNSRFRINILSADEFPIVQEAPAEVDIELDIPTLQDMLSRVKSFVAGPDETRSVLQGMLFELDARMLAATTSDGRRMAHVERGNSSDADKRMKMQVIVHANALTALGHLLEQSKGALSISTDCDRIWFSVDGTTLLARSLTDGKYPDYRRLIPTSTERRVYVRRDALAAALRRALLAAREEERPGLIKVSFGPDEMRISSNAPDLGDAEEKIPCRLEGTPLEMAFNGRYLLDVAGSAGCEELLINLTDSVSMSLIKPVDSDDLFYLVMPVRIKEAA